MPLTNSRQLLRVLADDWSSTGGMLQRFSRSTAAAPWQACGEPVAVSLGRAGLAWGIGLHAAVDDGNPHKTEGDGRAPAGLFALTALFGEAGPDSAVAQSLRLPYRCATGDLRCVDDPASRHYNRLVDRRDVAVDWVSAEEMRRSDGRYAIGAVIAHNPAGIAGAGSCIFLHVHEAPGVPTAGCTAGDPLAVQDVCAWLDAAARPVLVQLPRAESVRRAAAWQLPA